ncbi:purine nucleoside phosphorylase-like isoform X1 [Physella acuta]|nr:purine nucleoside phosphorylase-like isoform X1 [Physella acuta]XP_059143467.1 purine nucleoside phosphorylase-like isoform X1 [Physella acuta]XP_059143468.1 purine nucleoside phosphorylase-like isoform X1 [Physella acuta]XP_059143469.1 purine nucleoside phosphorylase-like isoform X1 [Physella acuta]XP_059143470.1 purine nucleoside phosphorylase-like isoform X1 [Physella acuta]
MSGQGARTSYTYEDIKKIADYILAKVTCRPVIGIICGSGLGGLAHDVQDQQVLPYTEIEGFPKSTVPGHEGNLVFGTLGNKPVVLMQGRFHCYEGYSAQTTTLPVRVMYLIGVKALFVTNAAGGINPNFNVGDIMIIKDHLNLPGFSGLNPLVGPNDERFGPRFPPVSRAYDADIRKLARSLGQKMGFQDYMREGVYSMVFGPNYETVTECRYLKIIGADAVGMSTVPEVLVAVHCGMKVFGLSLITNKVVMEYDVQATASHAEVLETSKKRSRDLQMLIAEIVKNYAD